MEFANKEYLLLLLLLVPYLIWYLIYRRKSEPAMRMSDTMPYRLALSTLNHKTNNENTLPQRLMASQTA